MFSWLSDLLKQEQVQSTAWVTSMMAKNEKGSYKNYKGYYDRHLKRIHNGYARDFLRFERFAEQNYKAGDRPVFMAIKTATYAYKLGQLKLAACITASVLAHNKRELEFNNSVVHPKLQRACSVLHKKIVTPKEQQSHKETAE